MIEVNSVARTTIQLLVCTYHKLAKTDTCDDVQQIPNNNPMRIPDDHPSNKQQASHTHTHQQQMYAQMESTSMAVR